MQFFIQDFFDKINIYRENYTRSLNI